MADLYIDDKWDIEIAKAKSTMLGVEDHGILTCFVHMDMGGSGQGAGGYSLDGNIKHTIFRGKYDAGEGADWGRVGLSYGMEFVRRMILAFGVDNWEDIPGRTVFVLRDKGAGFGTIKGIRPLPTEGGKEFIFEDLTVLIDQSKDIIKEKG